MKVLTEQDIEHWNNGGENTVKTKRICEILQDLLESFENGMVHSDYPKKVKERFAVLGLDKKR